MFGFVWFLLIWFLSVSFVFSLDYGIYCIVLYIVVLLFVLNYVFVFFGFDWLGFCLIWFRFDWLGFCLVCFRSVSFDLMVWYGWYDILIYLFIYFYLQVVLRSTRTQ